MKSGTLFPCYSFPYNYTEVNELEGIVMLIAIFLACLM
jgi:hypothetical protein